MWRQRSAHFGTVSTALVVLRWKRWKPSVCSRVGPPRSHSRPHSVRASPLAVAERDIRALSTARADRARSGDSAHGVRRDHTSPFQSARDRSVRSATDQSQSRRPVSLFFPGGLIVIIVAIYRYDRTLSCERSGTDRQYSLSFTSERIPAFRPGVNCAHSDETPPCYCLSCVSNEAD